MATGRERRAERLNERLRGAQRANVDDDSFSLDLGGLDLPGSPSPPAAAAAQDHDSPSSSAAKRRKLDSDAISAASQQSGSSSRRRSTRSGPKDPYDLPDTSKESALQITTTSASRNRRGTPDSDGTTRPARAPSSARRATSQQVDQNPDELETLVAPPSIIRSPARVQSPVRTRTSGTVIEEIGESPADAPGSGKRRRVPLSEAVSSSVRLLYALTSDDAHPESSSPLVRKTRRSDTSTSILSVRRSVGEGSRNDLSQEVDRLSPEKPNEQNVADDELSDAPSVNEFVQAGEPDAEDEQEVEAESEAEDPTQEEEEEEEEEEEQPEEGQQEQQEEEQEQEEAEEVGAIEAAKVLGKKRARPQRGISPELGSAPVAEEDNQQPAPKRRRGRPSNSPATQKQPAVRPKPSRTKKRPNARARRDAEVEADDDDNDDDRETPRPKKTKTKATRRRSGQSEGGDDNGAIEITLQRFVNHKKRGGDDDADPLHTEIPFANSGGESVVDVFAQVCDEVISSTLAQFRDMVNTAEDASKECRIKIRAIEAYREELNARFLQHAIHLNHWHSLRKRVRHVQKEKLALREEILRIRAEREQTALRMDAVRIKHEADTMESKYCLDASTLMHDVDLAVEQGRDAPELSRAAQKEAELANLELLVSRISEQASSTSFTGGMLKQVKDFNAFLERAAVALETR